MINKRESNIVKRSHNLSALLFYISFITQKFYGYNQIYTFNVQIILFF